MNKDNQHKEEAVLRSQRDRGMTLLEVVFAISILLIGVAFLVKTDSAKYRYQSQHEITQQMFFYAAGQLERLLQNQEVIQGVNSGADFPIKGFVVVSLSPEEVNDHLESIGVTVFAPHASNPPEPITLYTYRVK